MFRLYLDALYIRSTNCAFTSLPLVVPPRKARMDSTTTDPGLLPGKQAISCRSQLLGTCPQPQVCQFLPSGTTASTHSESTPRPVPEIHIRGAQKVVRCIDLQKLG